MSDSALASVLLRTQPRTKYANRRISGRLRCTSVRPSTITKALVLYGGEPLYVACMLTTRMMYEGCSSVFARRDTPLSNRMPILCLACGVACSRILSYFTYAFLFVGTQPYLKLLPISSTIPLIVYVTSAGLNSPPATYSETLAHLVQIDPSHNTHLAFFLINGTP